MKGIKSVFKLFYDYFIIFSSYKYLKKKYSYINNFPKIFGIKIVLHVEKILKALKILEIKISKKKSLINNFKSIIKENYIFLRWRENVL